jgi:hypothetical protein
MVRSGPPARSLPLVGHGVNIRRHGVTGCRRYRSCSRRSPIQSEAISSMVSPTPAATSPASRISIPPWPGNGWTGSPNCPRPSGIWGLLFQSGDRALCRCHLAHDRRQCANPRSARGRGAGGLAQVSSKPGKNTSSMVRRRVVNPCS